MIKLVHIADIHLGMENYGRMDKKTGLHSRLSDFLRCLDRAVDFALENKVDFFIFAGDAFKTRDPSPTYQREFAKRVKKIASAGIDIILLIGNHDLPNAFGKADTLEIYKTLEVENVHVIKKPVVLNFIKDEKNIWQLEDKDLKIEGRGKIQIAGLPWVPKSDFLSQEEFRGKNINETYNLMSHKMIDFLDNLKGQITDNPAVLLIHGTVAGAAFGSEQKTYLGSDILIPLNIIATKPWNYVALGHLHKYQILSENPPVIYSGSIERVDFGEEKEDKGFLYLTINEETKETKYEFIKTPARKFVSIKIEINSDDLDPTKKIVEEIKKYQIKDAVVKIIIKISGNLAANLQEKKIREVLQEADFVAAISKETERTAREKTLENVEEMSILEALEEYGKAKGVDEERIKLLKKYAEKMMVE